SAPSSKLAQAGDRASCSAVAATMASSRSTWPAGPARIRPSPGQSPRPGMTSPNEPGVEASAAAEPAPGFARPSSPEPRLGGYATDIKTDAAPPGAHATSELATAPSSLSSPPGPVISDSMNVG